MADKKRDNYKTADNKIVENKTVDNKKDKRLSRTEQIELARKYFSNFIKCILIILIYLIIFEFVEFLFSIYQKNVAGIEETIRNKNFGPITGFQPEWENILYKIKWIIFSEIFFLTIALYAAYNMYKYYSILRALPEIYKGFVNQKRIIWENIIIPIGLICGCFIGFVIFILLNDFAINTNTIYFIYGALPLIVVSLITIIVFIKGTKSMKIKYVLSVLLILILQY